MIPPTMLVKETDTLPGKEVFATIGDPRMVMKSLTKLYSDAIMATIREYCTNARDANVEANRASVPIEVTLPTILHPYFKVKDTGVGLSRRELHEVYISYGTSTKRNSNDFNGMLGYGSKSALAYTNSFTVTSVKNKRKYVAVIKRHADYSVSLKVVASEATTERNGVEITIPVQDHEAFNARAHDFFRFWKPGTVLVDGAEPEQNVGVNIANNLYYAKGDATTSYVVMGNVAYRLANPDALFKERGMKTYHFVAYVENGTVEFTPSREDLEYSEITKKTLNGILDTYTDKMISLAKAEIKSATTHFEALGIYNTWMRKLGKEAVGELTFNGETFKNLIEVDRYSKIHDLTRFDYHYRSNTNMVYNTNINLAEMDDLLIVHSFLPTLNSTHKKMARDYLKIKGLYSVVRKVLFTPTPIESKWAKPDQLVTMKEIKNTLPKPEKGETTKNGRPTGSFDYWTKDGKQIGGFVPEEGEVLWIAKTRNNFTVASILKALDSDATVIILPTNRQNKFKRENPDVLNFFTWAKPKAKKNGKALLSKEAKMALSLSRDSKNWAKALSKANIDDPRIKKAQKVVALGTVPMVDYTNWANYCSYLGVEFKGHGITKDDFVSDYPILAHVSTWNLSAKLVNELEIYMNAKYAEAKNV